MGTAWSARTPLMRDAIDALAYASPEKLNQSRRCSMSTMVRFIGLPRHIAVSVKEITEADGQRVTLVVFGNEQAQREPVLREQGVDPGEIWRELDREKERLRGIRKVDEAFRDAIESSNRRPATADELRVARRARIQQRVDALLLALHGCSRREWWAIDAAISDALGDASIAQFPASAAIQWPESRKPDGPETADAT